MLNPPALDLEQVELEKVLESAAMVVPPSIELSAERELVARVGGAKQTLLTNVPANVTVRADGGSHGVPGAFIGAFTDSPSSRHKFPIGRLVG